jgi:deoxyadenosine/deoxycytidine kinase
MANRMRSFFADFSMVLDDSYASVTLGRKERQLFRTIHAWIEQHLPTRTLLIRLECAPELELQRIRRRNRRAEKTITAEYLQRVNDAITANVKRLQRNEKVLVIDSGAINFARNPDAQVFVRRRVAEELNHA